MLKQVTRRPRNTLAPTSRTRRARRRRAGVCGWRLGAREVVFVCHAACGIARQRWVGVPAGAAAAKITWAQVRRVRTHRKDPDDRGGRDTGFRRRARKADE